MIQLTACPGSNGRVRRKGEHQVGVEHRVFAGGRVGKHRELLAGPLIGDHQGIGHFAAGSGGGRHCNHAAAMGDGFRRIRVIDDGTAVDAHDVDATRHVHGAAAADGDDRIGVMVRERRYACVHRAAQRIGFDLVEQYDVDAGRFQCRDCTGHERHRSHEGVGDDQWTLVVFLLAYFRECLPKVVGADDFDGLYHFNVQHVTVRSSLPLRRR